MLGTAELTCGSLFLQTFGTEELSVLFPSSKLFFLKKKEQ